MIRPCWRQIPHYRQFLMPRACDASVSKAPLRPQKTPTPRQLTNRLLIPIATCAIVSFFIPRNIRLTCIYELPMSNPNIVGISEASTYFVESSVSYSMKLPSIIILQFDTSLLMSCLFLLVCYYTFLDKVSVKLSSSRFIFSLAIQLSFLILLKDCNNDLIYYIIKLYPSIQGISKNNL